ncbi:MAG: hypothetical protein AB1625_01460, partial [Acidobacteriota bacterium]
MSRSPLRLVPRLDILTAAGVAAVLAAAAFAGIVLEDRPVSLLTKNLVMRNGKAYVPGADLARALGGTGRYDAGKLRYEITPGANGLLKVNPGALRSIIEPNNRPNSIMNPNDRRLSPKLEAPDSDAGGKVKLGQAPALHAVRLNLGDRDLVLEEDEHIVLHPGELGFSLGLLGRLLGGGARLEPSSGAWLLPPGGP